MRARIAVAFVFSVVSLLPAPSEAGAQQRDTLTPHASAAATLHGRVIRSSDGSPISGADVWVVVSDRHVLTDSTGAFRFDGLPAGIQLIQVRHVGLAVQRDTVVLSAEHDNVRTYALGEPSATLDTVRTVAGKQKYLSPRLQGFEERRLSGQGGHFVSDSAMRQSEHMTLANLISSHMPGLMQQTITVPGKGIYAALVSSRKACAGLVILNSCKGNANCYVAVYLDGVVQYSAKMGGPPPISSTTTTSAISRARSSTPVARPHRWACTATTTAAGRCGCGRGSGRGERERYREVAKRRPRCERGRARGETRARSPPHSATRSFPFRD